jgi:hypothetical protein
MNGDLITQTIDSAGASVLFVVIVLVSFALVMVLIAAGLLILRGIWRWLMRWTWNDVIVRTERRALGEK